MCCWGRRRVLQLVFPILQYVSMNLKKNILCKRHYISQHGWILLLKQWTPHPPLTKVKRMLSCVIFFNFSWYWCYTAVTGSGHVIWGPMKGLEKIQDIQTDVRTWLALGSPKTNLVFTPKSILHLFSDLFVHQNQPSQLQYFKFCQILAALLSLCFALFWSKFTQNGTKSV